MRKSIKRIIKEFNEFLNALYGDENNNKRIIPVIFITLSFAIMFFLLTFITNRAFDKMFCFYVSFFFLTSFLFILFSNLFQINKKNKNIRIISQILRGSGIACLIVLFVLALPVTISMFVINKTKFHNVIKYFHLYSLCLIISPIVSCILYLIIYYFLLGFNLFMANIIAVFISFNFNYLTSYTIIRIYFYCEKFFVKRKYKKGKITYDEYVEKSDNNEYDYMQSKKETYIFNFLIIAIVTLFAICINWGDENVEFVKDVLSAITLYIAFDRLYDKWVKSNLK